MLSFIKDKLKIVFFEISPSSLPVVSARHRNASYAIACRLPAKTSARPSSPASTANVSSVRVGRRGRNYRSRLHSLHGGKRTGTIKTAAIMQFSLSSLSSSLSVVVSFAFCANNIKFIFCLSETSRASRARSSDRQRGILPSDRLRKPNRSDLEHVFLYVVRLL